MKNVEGNKQGLTSAEAKSRLTHYGENILKQAAKVKPVKIFAEQFKDVLVIILLVSTVLSVIMGEISEAIAIMVIVFLNALLGFIQEFRTEKTLEALKKMAAPTAKVMRDGIEATVPAATIVPGDVIIVEAGDKVAADAYVLEEAELYADESILTGESKSVKKRAKLREALPSKEATLHMGTIATNGRGRALVVATGMNTEMGKIAGMIADIKPEQTPLQKRLEQLGKYIAIGCLGICAIVTITGILRGENVFDMIVTGISLSVAAVPEGLPAIVTISLALAVSRMLKRNAVVRKLDAVETLGCASVICSDKTGTITENKMTVKELATLDDIYDVSGSGHQKTGDIKSRSGRQGTAPDSLQAMFRIAALCNNAGLHEGKAGIFSRSDEYLVTGEATEIALAIAAAKGGVIKSSLENSFTRVAELPFSSERKCMSVLVAGKDGKYTVMTKGAADVVIKKCAYVMRAGVVRPITVADINAITAQTEKMARNALRVLSFAYKAKSDTGLAAKDEGELVFVGLAGMLDPPRKEVYDAIRQCRRAGIRPVMITGDHMLTACAVAKDIKLLADGDMVLSGEELDRLSDDEFERAVEKTSVYARVSPQHKLKIVRALKKAGHIVAMTGDGVNDAPAIKEANIGAAMGLSGTDVTKEAASILLLDDNFATLVAAVEEGRVIYQNIRKFIRYLISCNIGEVVTMFIGMLMGMPVILLPIQILLVNLVTDGLPAIALGLEPPENNEMSRPPRGRDESVFSGGLLTTIIFRGFLIGFATLGTFIALFKNGGTVELARTGALLTLVLSQLVHVFECKSESKNLFQINILSNGKLVLAVMVSALIAFAAVYYAPLAAVFGTLPLNGMQLLTVAIFSFSGPVISWIVSLFTFGKGKDKPTGVKPEDDR